MKLYRCDTVGVDQIVKTDCLIMNVDGANRVHCVWGDRFYSGYVSGDRIEWSDKSDPTAIDVLADGRIVLIATTGEETKWSPVKA